MLNRYFLEEAKDKKVEFMAIKGAGHSFDRLVKNGLTQTIYDFLKKEV